MADLIGQPNYAGQIAQGAAIPGAMADQWANANLTSQQAQGQWLANQLKRMQLPVQGQYIDLLKKEISN